MKHLVLTLAATLAAAPVFAAPIVPNTSGSSYTFDNANKTYFVTADTSLSADISGTDLYVGKTSASNLTTLSGTATFTVGAGANTTRRVPNVNGLAGYGVRTFGAFRANINGGNINNLFGEDNSITAITAGNITEATFSNNANVTMNNDGAAINSLFLGTAGTTQAPTANISGGVFTLMTLTANSVATITGGIVPTVPLSGVFLYDTGARANIFGTGLVATYVGLADNRDTFNVTGALQNGTVYTSSAPLPVSIRNETGKSNNVQRQFTLNNPAVVPEAGTLGLILPVIGMIGTLIRRKK